MSGPMNRGVNHPEQQQSRGQESGGISGTAGAVQEKAGELASNVAQSAERAWDSTRQGAEQAWDSTRQGAQQAARALATNAETAWGDLSGTMRRYPLATFCAGVGLGILLTLTFERSFRRS